jgi:aspartate beta-hydroxylase
MSEALEALVRRAGDAARQGRWDEAEAAWREVRRLSPRDPRAAFSLGVHALRRGDAAGACALIEEALASAPGDPFTLITLARARRDAGDAAGEGAAIDASLASDPYYLPGVLAKGGWFERAGRPSDAAYYYRNALRIAPPEGEWPAVLKPQLVHAREFTTRHSGAFLEALDAAIEPLLSGLPHLSKERWREAASIMAGRSQAYVQSANKLLAPRLPPIPFFDRSAFPWAEEVEAATASIRDELEAALAAQAQDFTPYITVAPGQPLNQWAPLNHSPTWSHYGLWRNGAPIEPHLDACPVTRRALETADMARIDGLCPNAMFSALAPHTEIPPHHGETNARVVAHLPLIVPPDCTYRVGFEHRTWTVGELLVFDDTLEHTARNDSDELRVVLIFDVWNPLLDSQERDIVRALMRSAQGFTGA